MWSAAVDPRVLSVRAVRPTDARARAIYTLPPGTRRLYGPSGEFLLIDNGSVPVRLDLLEGTTAAGPFILHFDLPDDDHFDHRISAIRSLRTGAPTGRRFHRLARRLLALHAMDAHGSGASLREIADLVLGPGDWPGDGEHRKSMARRMIATGELMMQDGPERVLRG